ncbi:MAG: chorismate-binding protein [Chryseolinea sp.]
MDNRAGIAESSLLYTFSESDLIYTLLGLAIQKNYSVALWRLPHETVHRLLISREITWLKQNDPLETLPPGFIFAPFDNFLDRVFLKEDICFAFEANTLKAPDTDLEAESYSWLQSELKNYRQQETPYYKSPFSQPVLGMDEFLALIGEAILEIEALKLQKIVPSRIDLIDLQPTFNVSIAFNTLCEVNPSALISFVSTPTTGTWLGATPELLVSVKDGLFRTVALAGTQRSKEGQELRSVAWTQKDIAEQALVERYIISCFKMIRLREYEEHGPKTVVAGNLLHLKSEFKVDMQATNFPQLGSVMLKLLHPTSAVCGSPLPTAMNFLKTHEKYERQFYTGYLGPVNLNRDIQLYVNLRCAQLIEGKAVLYAGPGITLDSNPELEWDETEIKMQTLRSALSGTLL